MAEEQRPRPLEIRWAPCSCGSPHCKRQHPTNLGMFYQGTGFEPEEVRWLNQAWHALALLPALTALADAYEEDTGLLSTPDREKIDSSRLTAARQAIASVEAI
jgi:hypothetical protein